MNTGIVQLLMSHGIRASLQRIEVMAVLQASRHHPTVEMVYSVLHPAFPTLSRTTVYQALELFCAKGAARRILSGDGEMRFEANTSAHGHFQCLKCAQIFDFPYAKNTKLPVPTGSFKILSQHLYYQGLCPSCGG